MIGLHSAEVVGELLKKGEIRVAMKGDQGEGWPELTYERFMSLENIETKKFKIVGAEQEVPENPKRWPGDKKTLFPENWTKEDIAKAFEKAEEKIKKVLLEEYGLPEYSPANAGKYWKNVNLDSDGNPIPIKTRINVNGKPIELEVGGKYDNEGKLDFTIQTIYPSN